MQFEKWLKLYKKINKSPYFEENISPLLIKLVKNYSQKFSFAKITNKYVNNALSNITSMSRVIIAFDAEFQTILDNNMPYTEVNVNGDYVAPMLREIGLILFIMDKKTREWYYIGNIHSNFEIYYDKLKLRFLLSQYCTVTPKTRKLMVNNDKYFDINNILNLNVGQILKIVENSFLISKFSKNKDKILDLLNNLNFNDNLNNKEKIIIGKMSRNIPYEVYGEYIKDTKYFKVFNSQWELYESDSLVKMRTMNEEQGIEILDLFYKLTGYSCIVLKGSRDIKGLNNTAHYLNYPNSIKFTDIYDIEIFNAFSRNKYNDAKLETTYNGVIKSNMYKKHVKPTFRIIEKDIGGDAHNPVVDSLFTIVVCIMINISLNKML